MRGDPPNSHSYLEGRTTFTPSSQLQYGSSAWRGKTDAERETNKAYDDVLASGEGGGEAVGIMLPFLWPWIEVLFIGQWYLKINTGHTLPMSYLTSHMTDIGLLITIGAILWIALASIRLIMLISIPVAIFILFSFFPFNLSNYLHMGYADEILEIFAYAIPIVFLVAARFCWYAIMQRHLWNKKRYSRLP